MQISIKWFVVSQYKCYQYTQEEETAIKNGQANRAACETHQGFVFTLGDEKLAPGCGKCWCCQPSNIYVNFLPAKLYKNTNN